MRARTATRAGVALRATSRRSARSTCPTIRLPEPATTTWCDPRTGAEPAATAPRPGIFMAPLGEAHAPDEGLKTGGENPNWHYGLLRMTSDLTGQYWLQAASGLIAAL